MFTFESTRNEERTDCRTGRYVFIIIILKWRNDRVDYCADVEIKETILFLSELKV